MKSLKKNVWFFHHYATPPSSTGLTRPYEFAKNLNKKGYNCTIFTSSFLHYSNEQIIKNDSLFKIEISEGVKFVYIKTSSYQGSKIKRIRNFLDFYINLFRVSKKIKEKDGNPYSIIASSAHPLTLLAGQKIAKKYSIECICEVRDLWPETFVAYDLISKKNPLLNLLYKGENWLYYRASKLIFTIEGGKSYIEEKGWSLNQGGNIDLSKVYYLNNGVDLEKFDNNKKEFLIKDQDLESSEYFKVVYTGSIRTINQIDKILDVAKSLQDSSIRFLIWGTGDQLQRLKKRITDEEINNVVFKGRVEKKYIPYITSSADLNIISGETSSLYRFGASLNKMFDYFAAGKPVLSFKTYGFSLIAKYNLGLELRESSADQIINGIKYFKDLEEKKYLSYCENARKAAEDYDYKILSQKLIEIMETK